MFGQNKPPKREDYDDLLNVNTEGFSTEEVDDATLNGQSLGYYVRDNGKPGVIYTNGGKAVVLNGNIAFEVTGQLKNKRDSFLYYCLQQTRILPGLLFSVAL